MRNVVSKSKSEVLFDLSLFLVFSVLFITFLHSINYCSFLWDRPFGTYSMDPINLSVSYFL